MNFIANLAVVAAIGLTLGGGSAWYSLRGQASLGTINIGPWTAFVYETTTEPDPYIVARSVAEGTVPLGATEGLLFEATQDSEGRQLLRQCDYRIEGSTPPARLWTLVAYGENGAPVAAAPGGRPAIASTRLVRFSDRSFRIALSNRPSAGNWIAIAGEGPVRLALRLYDTPITASAGLSSPSMPAIVREACRR